MVETPQHFGYESMRQSGFGKLYVSPEARELIKKHYTGVLKKSGSGITQLVIALRRDLLFDVVIIPKEREFYIDLNRSQEVKFADPEVRERIQLDYGPLREYKNPIHMLRVIGNDPFYVIKEGKNGAKLIDFSPIYHERKDTQHIFSETSSGGGIHSILNEEEAPIGKNNLD